MSGDDKLYVLSIFLGDQAFGIPIERIQDVLRPLPITRVPSADPHIKGLSNLRGRIVTVIDLREMIDTIDGTQDEVMKVIIDNQGELYGILVDRVGDVFALDKADIHDRTSMMNSTSYDFAQGFYQSDEKVTVILDTDKIIR